ncbi:MAG: hypothetical protein IJT87_04855 [Ruminiclostridium sp.]|nr:hypothetical protein [Ruminiclostridium sp.]
MKRLAAFATVFLMLLICSVTAFAEKNSYKLLESTMAVFGSDLVYMPDRQMYHFTGAGEASVELSVKDTLYFYIIVGSDSSASNGVTDNGVNSGCSVRVECLDENGERILPYFAVLEVPADHVFHRYSIGSDTMYAGLPENARKVRVSFSAQDSRQYIRSMEILSDDTMARDMSLTDWEEHILGNINAETTKADYWIMVGLIAAVALIMMIFAKARNNIKKGK